MSVLALHPRVIHVHALRKHPFAVYVGRLRPCPCRDPGCGHTRLGDFGNAFTVERHGVDAILLFVDMLSGLTIEHQAHVATKLHGLVLACHCRGKLPCCHGDVLAHFADGQPLPLIREWVLRVIGRAA